MVGLPRNPGPLSRTFRHGKVFLSLGTGGFYVLVGATGFEAADKIDATTNDDCPCDFCQGWRAAIALQSRGSNCLDVARLDADLQRMISAWGRLPEAIRRAILVLLGELNSLQSLPFLRSARRTPGTMLSLPVGQYPTHARPS